MKTIKITKGFYTKVDDEDFIYLCKFRWFYNCGYAARVIPFIGNKRKQKIIYMHREILETPSGYETDHINRDRLDNRKINLRVCKHTANMLNQNLHNNNRSGYAGVVWNKKCNKWQSQIKCNYKTIYLGLFDDIKEAIQVRKEKEIYILNNLLNSYNLYE